MHTLVGRLDLLGLAARLIRSIPLQSTLSIGSMTFAVVVADGMSARDANHA
jgi:hypothetical protein